MLLHFLLFVSCFFVYLVFCVKRKLLVLPANLVIIRVLPALQRCLKRRGVLFFSHKKSLSVVTTLEFHSTVLQESFSKLLGVSLARSVTVGEASYG